MPPKFALLLFCSIIVPCAFRKGSPVVVNLNTGNFDKFVNDGKEIWVVEFCEPLNMQCEAFKNEFEKAAKTFEGIIKFGFVSSGNKDLILEYNIRKYPTIKIFNGYMGVPEVYSGDRKLRELVSFLEVSIHSKINSRLNGVLDPSMFKNKFTTELTEENFEDTVIKSEEAWLVAFYSLFSNRCKEVSTHWTEISERLEETVELGSLDATVNFATASECQIEGYPTIQFFPYGLKQVSSGINYQGENEASAIIEWTIKMLTAGVSKRIVEIVDSSSLKKACEMKLVCIVSILPRILDCQENCRNEYLFLLSRLWKKYKDKLWGWVWSEARVQPEIEAVLEVDGDVDPTMVAVDVKAMKFISHSKQFTYEDIVEFLENLSFEDQNVKQLTVKEMPKINIVEPWVGLDSTLPSKDEL